MCEVKRVSPPRIGVTPRTEAGEATGMSRVSPGARALAPPLTTIVPIKLSCSLSRSLLHARRGQQSVESHIFNSGMPLLENVLRQKREKRCINYAGLARAAPTHSPSPHHTSLRLLTQGPAVTRDHQPLDLSNPTPHWYSLEALKALDFRGP